MFFPLFRFYILVSVNANSYCIIDACKSLFLLGVRKSVFNGLVLGSSVSIEDIDKKFEMPGEVVDLALQEYCTYFEASAWEYVVNEGIVNYINCLLKAKADVTNKKTNYQSSCSFSFSKALFF